MSGDHVEQGMPVVVHTEGKDDGFTQEAVQAAINPMLDQVNTCLDQLEERNDHLPGRLQECLNLTGIHMLSSSSHSRRPQVIGSPWWSPPRVPGPGPNPACLSQALAWALTTWLRAACRCPRGSACLGHPSGTSLCVPGIPPPPGRCGPVTHPTCLTAQLLDALTLPRPWVFTLN